jgi:hypothetical protein
LQIRDGAILKAEGTATDKITFTAKTATNGFWEGITIDNEMPNSMSNCIIEYAGKDDGSNLYIKYAKLSLTDCLIQHSSNYGIYMSDDTRLTHSGVTFMDNEGGNVYNSDSDATTEALP